MDRFRPTAMPAAEIVQEGLFQQRSLSLPHSRIVLNPQNFTTDATEVEQNCDVTLPLGLGYYAFDEAIVVPRFLSFWTSGTGANPSVGPLLVPATSWLALDRTLVSTQGQAVAVALAGNGLEEIGRAAVDIVFDPARPVLRLCVRDVVGQWSLHIHGEGPEPVQLVAGSAIAGLHFLDLREFLPEAPSGVRRVTLGVIGADAMVVIEELALVAAVDVSPFGVTSFETDWSPVGLGVRAQHAGLAIEGGDTFADLDSVVRELRLEHALPADAALTVVGRHLAAPQFDADRRVVVSKAARMTVAVAVPAAESIRYYPDEAALAAGEPGAAAPTGDVGVWAIRLRAGETIYRVGAGLHPDDPEQASALALGAVSASELDRRRHWAGQWDELLGRAPHPETFGIRAVDADGLDAGEVRAGYYTAFVGLLSNVLPPQPELPYLFPTIATGKGSMWNHGTAGARSAAAWETFLAIQFLAYVDADLAWACFTGLMSRVDEEGSLGGESLPSRKAQTAAVLFALTGDRGALADSYPGLKRLLIWQAAQPRWIYGTYDFPGEQDAEFLSSLIIDLRFGAQLAEVLGELEDAGEFDRLRVELSRDYRDHCFIGADRQAVQHWFPEDETAALRSGPRGADLPVTSGLAVPGLTGWQLDSLLARFDAQFDGTDQLAGFDFVKHPNVGHTATGLIDHGRPEQALALVNAMLRDVIRSGSFAEVYDRGPDRPRPSGVRPSIFGITQVLDAVWLNNGLRMDLGAPQAVSLPGVHGGVHGIRMRGSEVTVVTRPESR